jgi:hypothetical protein
MIPSIREGRSSKELGASGCTNGFSFVGVGVVVGMVVEVGAGIGVGFFIATPLLHTNFLPDLTQVYFIPAEVLVCPTFLQTVPGFTAAVAIDCTDAKARLAVSKTRIHLRIGKL